MTPRWFVAGTGTGVGKTSVACALARRLRADGVAVRALKPIETGCEPAPEDAVALAEACGEPALAHWPGLHRGRRPLSPRAAAMEGEPPVAWDAVVAATKRALGGGAVALVEGAGGLFVPIDPRRDTVDLVRALDLPVLLVAPDRLGVQSDVLATVAAAEARGAVFTAVVLNRFGPADASRSTNRAVLAERLRIPVLVFDGSAGALLAPLGLAATRTPPSP